MSKSDTGEKGWTYSYQTSIMDNIQIEITNIHIRLEDQKENLMQQFGAAAGLGAQIQKNRFTAKTRGLKEDDRQIPKVYDQMCIGVMVK